MTPSRLGVLIAATSIEAAVSSLARTDVDESPEQRADRLAAAAIVGLGGSLLGFLVVALATPPPPSFYTDARGVRRKMLA